MKKSYSFLLVFAACLVTMSFASRKDEKNLFTKVNTTNAKSFQTAISDKESLLPPTVAVVVALAETSYAATVVATAAALNWLFGDVQESTLNGNYKAILEDIDMHALDNSSK